MGKQCRAKAECSARRDRLRGYVRQGMSYAEAGAMEGLSSTAVYRAVQQAGGLDVVMQSMSGSFDRDKPPCEPPTQAWGNPDQTKPRNLQDVPAGKVLLAAVTGRKPDWDDEGPIVTSSTPPEPSPVEAFNRMAGIKAEKSRGVDRIEFPSGNPVALAFLSDLHFGGRGVDYQQARRDALTVQDTPGMYAVLLGDLTDNWILPAMQHLQQGALLSQSEAVRMLRGYLAVLGERLVAAVAGNHDLWTDRMAGLDLLKMLLPTSCKLYDRHELSLDIGFADKQPLRMLVRHKWPHSSQYNPTHGIEWAARFGDTDFDIGVGGHTHPGTFCRPFPLRAKMRQAVMIGTYKLADDYRRAGGWPRQPDSHRGAGALLMYPDGRLMWLDDLTTAAQFLSFCRVG